jgi:Mor family transcriptional regulator
MTEAERIIRRAQDLGITSETKVRNFRIRAEFIRLRRSTKFHDVIEGLSRKYFLSDSQIGQIVRGIKTRKPHGRKKINQAA